MKELTPEQIAQLRATSDSVDHFMRRLKRHGYRQILTWGCFKAIFRYRRGKYVVKVEICPAHIPEQNRSYKHGGLKWRRRLLPLLAYGNDFQVQRWVKECREIGCGVRGVPDTYGHNHTHIGQRKLAFDWLPKRSNAA